jgi:hypothetical protein
MKPEVFVTLITAAAAIVAIIRIRGQWRARLAETKLEEGPRPPAKLGIASVVTPILAAGITFIWLCAVAFKPNNGSSLPNDPDGIGWIIGLWIVAPIIGVVLAIRSLRKRERRPLIAAVGLLVNGMACAYIYPRLVAFFCFGVNGS